mmetsp:Transcript_144989/g.278244  ORF Transcript_144989/g.278244 Transcript_144989/m.278244 type:complete len:428 (+) Transcript_144989:83-1366(+)
MHTFIPGCCGILCISLCLCAALCNSDAEDTCADGELRSRHDHALLQVKSDLPEKLPNSRAKFKPAGAVDVPERMAAAFEKSKRVDIPESVSSNILEDEDSKDRDIPHVAKKEAKARQSKLPTGPQELRSATKRAKVESMVAAASISSEVPEIRHARLRNDDERQQFEVNDDHGGLAKATAKVKDEEERLMDAKTRLADSTEAEADEPITLEDGLEPDADRAIDVESRLKMDASESAVASDDLLDDRAGDAASKESSAEASSVSVADGCPQYRCGHIEFIANSTRKCIGKSTTASRGIGAEAVLQDQKSFDCVSFVLPPAGKGPLVDYSNEPPLCLTIAHGQFTDGNTIHYKPCSGEYKDDSTFTAAPDQTWILPTDNVGPVRASIFPDKCLNVVGGNASLGNRVQIWGCGNGDDMSETFRFPSFEIS